tara:strand:+ start:752 stop:928 length:177 start_codon:yes stop_codon:yes gene_type:complete
MKKIKKRTLNELRQLKTYGYRPPSPSKDNPKFELSPTQIKVLENKGYKFKKDLNNDKK